MCQDVICLGSRHQTGGGSIVAVHCNQESLSVNMGFFIYIHTADNSITLGVNLYWLCHAIR